MQAGKYGLALMCNLYSQTKGQQAILEFTRAARDTTGKLPRQPGIYPDYGAPGLWSWRDRPPKGQRDSRTAR